MKTTEILSRLHQADFTEKQAKQLAEILEDMDDKQVTKDHLNMVVNMVVNQAKYELVKWIVAGVIVNGLAATLLKYAG